MHSDMTNKQKPVSSSRNGMLCSLLVFVCILATYPVAEMGLMDDWSYVKTALVFSQTHHIVYNGWATAMLGWTIPWGALFIHLFGFSFTTVRLSTLPLALGSVFLFHASLRRFGVTPRNAIFGALTLGLSPLFLPLAASYMTDVAGLFCILLCLYLCQRAVSARSDLNSTLWLILAASSNVVGGTVRQIVWLGALIMVPSTAWFLRKRGGVLVVAIFVWLASLGATLVCMRWFRQQPYALPENINQGPIGTLMLLHLTVEVVKALLCLSLLVLPILIAWISGWHCLSRAARMRSACIFIVLLCCALVFGQRGSLDHRIMPWLGHVIGTLSILPTTGEMLGTRPVTLTPPWRVALSLLVIMSAVLFLEQMVGKPWRVKPCVNQLSLQMKQALWMLGPFSITYAAFLLPRAIYFFIFDRYLLGLLPVAITFLCLTYQRCMRERLPALCTVILVVSALYAVAGTHDWFALNRARVAAVAQIEMSGVPATAIQGGYDYDGGTQIEVTGYVNDPRIIKPPNSYQPNLEPLGLQSRCRLDFAPYTPAVRPRYFVVFSLMPCLQLSPYHPVTYSTWLPPFRRTIFIQEAPFNQK
jgi:hypothetical protein